MNKIVFTVLLLIALALGAHAQDKNAADAGKKMSAAERKSVIDTLIQKINSYYVYAGPGKKDDYRHT